MTNRDKANRMTRALKELRNTEDSEPVRDAITDYLETASDESKARFYDIIRAA